MCGGGERSILLLHIVARFLRQYMYVYGACLFLRLSQ